MYQLVIILKSINEIALMALIGQGALYLLAGAKREGNVVYFILKTMTMPVFKFARWITPRVILDQHLGWVALFIVLLAEVLLISAKITLHVQAASGG